MKRQELKAWKQMEERRCLRPRERLMHIEHQNKENGYLLYHAEEKYKKVFVLEE